jgi:kumamolisin
MTSKLYPNITPAVAEKFLKGALASEFVTDRLVDLSYDQPFQLIGHGLVFNVTYNGTNQTATVILISYPFFLSPNFIFDQIGKYIAQAAGGTVPNMSVWPNGVARPHFRIGHLFSKDDNPSFRAHDAALTARSFQPKNIKKYYGIQGDGEGQTIAIIELGGAIYRHDLISAGIDLGMVTAVNVDSGTQSPGDADGEVALDIQIAAAIAPKAKIVVYFAPNTDTGFFNAVAQAYKDLGGYCPTCVASGDNGATDGEDSNHVDFPASAPYAIACGGTRLTGSVETVWNDLVANGGATGGGVSSFFPVPDWQKGLMFTKPGMAPKPLTGRGVPDVAANADPRSGYVIWVNGQKVVVGGTSAVAPLMAALLACCGFNTVSISWGAPEDQWTQSGRLNLANMIQQNAMSGNNILPELYANPHVFSDIPSGDNGGYWASPGWDAVTGLGSPRGQRVFNLLT